MAVSQLSASGNLHGPWGSVVSRYGIRKNGQHVARLRIVGAGANDWEDIAVGPGDASVWWMPFGLKSGWEFLWGGLSKGLVQSKSRYRVKFFWRE